MQTNLWQQKTDSCFPQNRGITADKDHIRAQRNYFLSDGYIRYLEWMVSQIKTYQIVYLKCL